MSSIRPIKKTEKEPIKEQQINLLLIKSNQSNQSKLRVKLKVLKRVINRQFDNFFR